MSRVISKKYNLLSLLGTGGMSEVYLALDTKTGTKVAVKILDRKLSKDEDYIKRFKREIEISKALKHPNIVKIISYGKDKDTYYIVYEHIDGLTLDKYIKSKKLSIREIEDISLQILQGLSYAHSKGVIHRDIKPSNIMISKDGSVKILDFGIARATTKSTITKTGMFMGSPHYTSPEQIDGKKIDSRTDIYSLGIVIYEMVEGKAPFESESLVGFAHAHLHKPVPKINRKLPNYLLDIIYKCLNKKPIDRFNSVRQIIDIVKINNRTTFKKGVREFRSVEEDKKRDFEVADRPKWKIYIIFVSMLAVIAIIITLYSLKDKKETDNSEEIISVDSSQEIVEIAKELNGKESPKSQEDTSTSQVDSDIEELGLTDTQKQIILRLLELIQEDIVYGYEIFPESGYPNSNKWISTDVISVVLNDSGYDLMELIYEDMLKHKEDYPIDIKGREQPLKYLDFRDVFFQEQFFRRHALELPFKYDLNDVNNDILWWPGDILYFQFNPDNPYKDLGGFVSPHSNEDGIPLVIMISAEFGSISEVDVLMEYDIVGHFRYPPPGIGEQIEFKEKMEDENEAPTISLKIYEGPVYSVPDDIVYYRVEAIVTGDPEPIVEYNLTGASGGSLGKNKIQINLDEGHSVTLNAVAKNSEGSIEEDIILEWINESEKMRQITNYILNNIGDLIGYYERIDVSDAGELNPGLQWCGGLKISSGLQNGDAKFKQIQLVDTVKNYLVSMGSDVTEVIKKDKWSDTIVYFIYYYYKDHQGRIDIGLYDIGNSNNIDVFILY